MSSLNELQIWIEQVHFQIECTVLKFNVIIISCNVFRIVPWQLGIKLYHILMIDKGFKIVVLIHKCTDLYLHYISVYFGQQDGGNGTQRTRQKFEFGTIPDPSVNKWPFRNSIDQTLSSCCSLQWIDVGRLCVRKAALNLWILNARAK